MPQLKKIPVEQRFWQYVSKDVDGCWRWTGATRGGGYGAIWIGGRTGSHVPAHRVSYEMAHGPVPAGLWVLHRCNNKRCVNPEHIYAGTVRQNVMDAIADGVWPSKKGRSMPWMVGIKNSNAVLDPVKVRQIRARQASGESMRSLARHFNVNRTTIKNVVIRAIWAHVI